MRGILMCVWSTWTAIKASWWCWEDGSVQFMSKVHRWSWQESFLYDWWLCFSLNRRKDQNLLSPVNCWYLLLNQVRRESKDHATLSDIYLNNVIMRFMQISEDSTRLMKKVRTVFNYKSSILQMAFSARVRQIERFLKTCAHLKPCWCVFK